MTQMKWREKKDKKIERKLVRERETEIESDREVGREKERGSAVWPHKIESNCGNRV